MRVSRVIKKIESFRTPRREYLLDKTIEDVKYAKKIFCNRFVITEDEDEILDEYREIHAIKSGGSGLVFYDETKKRVIVLLSRRILDYLT